MPGDRTRSFFEALSRPPEHTWPDAFLHHGARVALLLLLAGLVYVLFPAASVPNFPAYEAGMVPDQDIIAQVEFPIYKSDAELAEDRQRAADAVAPVFRYDGAAVDSMSGEVNAFLARVDSAATAHGAEAAVLARLQDVLEADSLAAPGAPALLRLAANRAGLKNSLRRVIRRYMTVGAVSGHDLTSSLGQQQQLNVIRDGTRRLIPKDSVFTTERVLAAAARELPLDAAPGLTEFQRMMLTHFFVPTLSFDRQATDSARAKAQADVSREKGQVKKGERVVTAHEPLTDRDMERLLAYKADLERTGELGPGSAQLRLGLGILILDLLILAIFGFLLFFYRPQVYGSFRHLLLLTGLLASVLALASLLTSGTVRAELVPIAFPALVVAVLWDGRMALNMALIIALLLATQTPFASGLSPRVFMVVGGAAAALSVRVVRRRAQGLVLGGVVAVAYALAAVALGLYLSWSTGEIASHVLWGSVNGVASALVALGFLPLFEAVTRITTDQTLLELADLNRPLLKRLSLEASGTYAHSINVANLAEAAARAIGANPLLARVGAYYHDVGKIITPQYFVENQPRGRNPHDQLDPAVSAAIVRNHVVEGLRLAEQAKLPACVSRFIPEHHGTQAIGFFYEKARQQQPESEVDLAGFSYPGPRPTTKETAITMLADSIESAAKALQDPNPERIRALVDRIVEGKISHGQLEEAPLTLRELATIKEQFAGVLNGMYHHRIDYPPSVVQRLPEQAAAGSATAQPT